MSKVLLQKIIEEILIKKICVHAKGFFTDNHRRNLDQKGSFTEKYRRNFDQKGSFLSKVYFIFLLVLFIFHKKCLLWEINAEILFYLTQLKRY